MQLCGSPITPGGDARPIDSAPSGDGATDAPPTLGPWANIELIDLGPGTPYDDPMLTDDFELFFAGPAANGVGQDIYSAKPDGIGGYETPVPIAAINTARSDTTL